MVSTVLRISPMDDSDSIFCAAVKSFIPSADILLNSSPNETEYAMNTP